MKLDIEFHQLIAAASANRALQLCRQPISQLFYPAFLKVFSRLHAGERLIFAHEKNWKRSEVATLQSRVNGWKGSRRISEPCR